MMDAHELYSVSCAPVMPTPEYVGWRGGSAAPKAHCRRKRTARLASAQHIREVGLARGRAALRGGRWRGRRRYSILLRAPAAAHRAVQIHRRDQHARAQLQAPDVGAVQGALRIELLQIRGVAVA